MPKTLLHLKKNHSYPSPNNPLSRRIQTSPSQEEPQQPLALARGVLFFEVSKRLVLMGDWNAIFDPKLDKGGWGASGSDRCEISLTDLFAEHDLVDRFRLDNPGRVIWMWLGDSPFGQIRSYLDRM